MLARLWLIAIAFLSPHLKSTKNIPWPSPDENVCVIGGHVTSRNQGGKGEKAWDRGSVHINL